MLRAYGDTGWQRGGLAYRDRGRVDAPVLLRAAHDQDAGDARGRAGAQHVGGAADVDPLHGFLVVPRRAHVAPGREVEHDLGGDGGDPAPHRVGVGDVDRVGSTAIEHDDVVTALQEVRNEVTTDEPSSAGDDGAHGIATPEPCRVGARPRATASGRS